jgi:ubiquinone/menaquinone biosynthesis C-methylase UbiE
LIAAYPERITYGLDPDLSALRLGKLQTQSMRFVCGQAEALPYSSGEFDLVVARVTLAYTDIRTSLREIHRVLRPGGMVWMTLHPFSLCWEQAKRSNVNGWIFFGYIFLNGLSFHLFNAQFSLLGRQESFQTDKGMTRALRRSGFSEIKIQRGRHFLITARK